jgi:hypothetical protein
MTAAVTASVVVVEVMGSRRERSFELAPTFGSSVTFAGA